MKKTLLTVLILSIISLPAIATDDTNSTDDGIESLMKSTPVFEDPYAGQKQISDEDYQKALKQVQAKQAKRKKIKNKPLKGNDVNQENNGGYLEETAEKNLLLIVPETLINGDETEIPTGHYKIVGEKKDEKVFLDFYQSSKLIAKVPAIETNYDFDEMAINYVKIEPYDAKKVKVIYGSMDFNAYTFLKIKQ